MSKCLIYRGAVVTVVTAAATLSTLPLAKASSIALVEPSFENATAAWVPVGANTGGEANDRSTANDANLPGPGGPSSFYWRIYQNSRNASDQATVTQTLVGTGVLPNSTYTLIVACGDRIAQDFPTIDIRVGTVVSGVFTELAGGSLNFTAPTPDGTFSDATKIYTTGAIVPTGDLAVQLFSNGQDSATVGGTPNGLQSFTVTNDTTDSINDAFVAFDNVQLDVTSVPEPASLGLLGAVGLLVLRRRGKK
jgi:hypothetical protein